MSGGQTSTINKTEVRDPYAPAVPALQTLAGNALNLYNQDPTYDVYSGQRVAGFSPLTQNAFSALRTGANQGMPLVNAGGDFTRSLINRGGTTTPIQQAVNGLLNVQGIDASGVLGVQGMDRLRPFTANGVSVQGVSRLNGADVGGVAGVQGTDIAGMRRAANQISNNNYGTDAARELMRGRYDADPRAYAELNRGLSDPSQTEQSLLDVAQGRFLGEANPYTSEMISNAQADAINAAKGTFAASGRYGSGMFSQAAGDAAARVGTDLRYRDYEAERARQAQAASAIDSAEMARTGMRSSLYGAEDAARAANAGRLVTAAGLGQQGQEAALRAQGALNTANQFNANLDLNREQAELAGRQFNSNFGLNREQAELAGRQYNTNLIQRQQEAERAADMQRQQFNANLAMQQQQAALDAQRFNSTQDQQLQQARLAAAQGDRAAAQGALSAIPGLQQSYMLPAQTMAGIGSQLDQRAQNVLNAQRAAFDERQAAPWKSMGLLSGIALPVAGAGGTTQGYAVTETSGPPLFQQLLGGGLAASNLLTGSSGGLFSGLASGASGLLGGGGSMFSPSLSGWGGYDPYSGSSSGWL